MAWETTHPALLKSDDLFGKDGTTGTYDRSRGLSRYLLMHYGAAIDVFDDLGRPLAVVHDFPGRLSRRGRAGGRVHSRRQSLGGPDIS